MGNMPKLLIWCGIILILIAGFVHVIEAPEALKEVAYKGWLFYANGLGALVAAVGIFLGRRWGWSLGALIAALTVVGYVLSRTVGLPLIPPEPDEWLEPLGVVAGGAEILFLLVFARMKGAK